MIVLFYLFIQLVSRKKTSVPGKPEEEERRRKLGKKNEDTRN